MGNLISLYNVKCNTNDSNLKPAPIEIATTKETKITECKHIENWYPGTIEDLHNNCRKVMPIFFDGAIIVINKSLSNHFQTSHTFNLHSSSDNNNGSTEMGVVNGFQQKSAYQFGTIFIGTKNQTNINQHTIKDSFPILIGEIDRYGNLTTNIIHEFDDNIQMKMINQMNNKQLINSNISCNYLGKTFTTTCSLMNINLLNLNGTIIGQYLQSITKKFALGCELMYEKFNNTNRIINNNNVINDRASSLHPPQQHTLCTIFGRYKLNDNILWTGQLRQNGHGHLCYYQKCNDQLKFAIEMMTNFNTHSIGRIGYEINLPKLNFTFNAMIDTNWNVCSMFQKRLVPLPVTFSLCALLNHTKNRLRLGFSIIID